MMNNTLNIPRKSRATQMLLRRPHKLKQCTMQSSFPFVLHKQKCVVFCTCGFASISKLRLMMVEVWTTTKGLETWVIEHKVFNFNYLESLNLKVFNLMVFLPGLVLKSRKRHFFGSWRFQKSFFTVMELSKFY